MLTANPPHQGIEGFNPRTMLKIQKNEHVSKIQSLIEAAEEERVVILTPLVFLGIDYEVRRELLHELLLHPSIAKRVQSFIKKFNIDSSCVGAHFRGSDFRPFGQTEDELINFVKTEIDRCKNIRIFLCSDEANIERKMRKMFPKNIIVNDKGKDYVKKDIRSMFKPWHTGHLWWRSQEAVKSALMDLYILSNTNIRFYNEKSTFAETAIVMGASNYT